MSDQNTDMIIVFKLKDSGLEKLQAYFKSRYGEDNGIGENPYLGLQQGEVLAMGNKIVTQGAIEENEELGNTGYYKPSSFYIQLIGRLLCFRGQRDFNTSYPFNDLCKFLKEELTEIVEYARGKVYLPQRLQNLEFFEIEEDYYDAMTLEEKKEVFDEIVKDKVHKGRYFVKLYTEFEQKNNV